jgi:hypothetical protein
MPQKCASIPESETGGMGEVVMGTVQMSPGIVIFTARPDVLGAFSAAVLAPATIESVDNDVLVRGGVEVYLHRAALDTEAHPHVRSDAAMKPQFTVDDMERAKSAVVASGGILTDRAFTWNDVVHVDVVDPDGNVVQLRCHVGSSDTPTAGVDH